MNGSYLEINGYINGKTGVIVISSTTQIEGNCMTTHEEKHRSLLEARAFLFRLLDPQQTPRVPVAIRKEAARVVKHYPSPIDLYSVLDEDLGMGQK